MKKSEDHGKSDQHHGKIMEISWNFVEEDLRLGILSPRQTPALLTSVSKVMTPTRLTSASTSSNNRHQSGNLHYIPQQHAENLKRAKNFNHGQSACASRSDKDQNLLHFSDGSHLSAPRSDKEGTNLPEQTSGTGLSEQQESDVDVTRDVAITPEVQIMMEARVDKDKAGVNKGHIEVNSQPFQDSDLFIQQIESQIIPDKQEKEMLTYMPDDDFNDLFPIITNEELKTEVNYGRGTSPEQVHYMNNGDNFNFNHDIFVPQQAHRSHTSSIGSNSIGSEYGSMSTRCSVCDGCSSAMLSTHPLSSNNYLFNHRTGSGSRMGNEKNWNDLCNSRDIGLKNNDSQQQVLSYTRTHVNPVDLVDTRTIPKSRYNMEDETELQNKPRQDCIAHVNPTQQTHNALSNVVVLATWIQLSRYKDLQLENLKQKKVLSYYERRLESLIMMVLLLSKHMKKSMSKLESQQLHLNKLQDKQVYYEKRLRRLYFGLICLLLLYIVQVTSFRKQLYSVVRLFGIFEVFEKVNRTRKVVAKNWRNIPSLLTDFWRIFIFRSRSRLQERFS